MTLFKYCKKMKDSGNCSKPKPYFEDDYEPDTEGLVGKAKEWVTVRKCIYTDKINDLELVPTKNNRSKTYRLYNGCPWFEPVDGLEKMLEVTGEMVFLKGDYVLFEDETNYYIARSNDEPRL